MTYVYKNLVRPSSSWFFLLLSHGECGFSIRVDVMPNRKLKENMKWFLPARASEQGNVIGSVRIYMCTKNIVIERTSYNLPQICSIFPKLISPSAGENSGDSV